MKIKMALAVTLASVLVLCTACSGGTSSTEGSSSTTQNENTVVTPEETQSDTSADVTVTADNFRSFPETDASYFTWKDCDGGVCVRSCSSKDAVIVVPARLGGKDVVEQDYMAFCAMDMQAVVLPDTVKSLGESCFGSCTSLQYVELGSGVKTIGELAFSGCSSLETLTVPEGTTTLGEAIVCVCAALTDLYLPASVTEIDDCITDTETTPNLTVHAPAGSYAEQVAIANGLPVVND